MPEVLQNKRPAGRLRREIALSWQRSTQFGVDPNSAIDNLSATDFDRHSRLLAAAGPVLDDMAAELAGSPFCIILADAEARIVDRRFGDRVLEAELDTISAVPGCQFVEETTGTNAIATAFELRRGVSVTGAEHFVESMKKFCCFGQPILHPITGRLEGVLDISGAATEANPLLRPFIAGAVRQIEQHLLNASRYSQQRLFSAFRVAAAQRSRPVVALDSDIVIVNHAAADMLESADHATVRELALDQRRETAATSQFELRSGRRVKATVTRAPGTRAAAIVELTPQPTHRAGQAHLDEVHGTRDAITAPRVERDLNAYRGRRTRVAVSGPCGSGRSSTARALAGEHPVVSANAVDALRVGSAEWARRFVRLSEQHRGLIIVEEIQLLPPALITQISQVMHETDTWLVLTSCPAAELTGPHASLAARCPVGMELPALSTRRDEIPAIACRMMAEIADGRNLRLVPSVLETLAGHDWPGNLRELATVLRYATSRRSVGDITVADLPPNYQRAPSRRRLTDMERAEYEAIAAALLATDGNKVSAARRLGISRSTLYERMRNLGMRR